MNANLDLERRLADFYATEAPQRAPARVLEGALLRSTAHDNGAGSSACRGGSLP